MPESSPVPYLGPFAGLAGCRVVVTGFSPEATEDMITVFQNVGAAGRAGKPSTINDDARSCDLMLASLPALDNYATALKPVEGPIIAAMSPSTVMGYLPWVRQVGAECLFYPCSDQELLARAVIAIHRWNSPLERPNQKQFRVLLADDDPSVTDLLRAAIESDRMQCRCTRNGVQTLEVIAEWHPDLIILDVNMPNVDGYGVLDTLQKEGSRIPVLMLTGRDHQADVTRGFQLGAKDYVIKPFNPIAVLTRIRRLLPKAA